MENYSLSDIASVAGNEGFGGNSFFWIFALLILFGMGGNGGLFGGNSNNAMTNEILSGQKFDALSRQINQIGDGLCSSTYALNNSIMSEGRALQTQLCNMASETNAVTVAQTQKILDAISQNKIDTLQSQVNNLTMQNAIQTATAGVVKYPTTSAYCSGSNPFCGCSCGF